MQKVAESFWLMWHREYLDGLREIRSGRKAGKPVDTRRRFNVDTTLYDIASTLK